MRKLTTFIIATALAGTTCAQSVRTTQEEQMRMARETPEVVSCVYRAYPGPDATPYTPAPKGYSPVFISHYGRHGSRYLTEDERYTWLLEQLEKHDLTETGREVLGKVRIAWKQAEGRGGTLTQLGERQHREIADRMYRNFPALFKGDQRIRAYSSTSGRCIMSMTAFCELLKERNPRLEILHDACEGNMRFMAYSTPAQKALMNDSTEAACQAYTSQRAKLGKTEAFIHRLFREPGQIKEPYQFMEQFYFLAQDMQDCGRPTELLSYLAPEEVYNVWRIKNCQMYLSHSDSPLSHGAPAECADSLLSHIIHDADKALQENRMGATLRFGHDTALLKLLARMKVKECSPQTTDMDNLSLIWQDFNIVPMAANLQLIFYRNKKGHILVRLLLNENEVHLDLPTLQAPYYDWNEVKTYWKLHSGK